MKRLQIYQSMLCASTKINYIFVFALLITLAVCCFAPQAQAGPAPIQTFFVPLPELQVQRSLETVDTNNDIGRDMRSIISIVATGDSAKARSLRAKYQPALYSGQPKKYGRTKGDK